MSAGLKTPDSRIDLAIVGEADPGQADGRLWYMAMCQGRAGHVRHLSVERMKAGDACCFAAPIRVSMKTMSLLGPCLADPP